jgi:hypothetical protein
MNVVTKVVNTLLNTIIVCGGNMEDFKQELQQLLDKHKVALICRSVLNEDDYSVEVGFQDSIGKNTWTGRNHLTAYEISYLKEKQNER